MLAIDGRGGSILLTDGMCVSRISKSLHIGGADLRREHRRGRAPSAERIVDDGFRGRRQDALGKRFRLSEQRPRPEGKRESCIGAIPYGLRRQDVKNGEPVDTIRMVKGHAIGDATATIMSSDREARKSKPLHHGHHVLRHGSLRIWRMVPGGGRAAAAPVAAKIDADNRKVAGKQRRDAAPHQVRLRKAVQQENRRPGPVRAHENAGLTRLDLGGCEVIHHFRLCSFLSTRAGICSPLVSRGSLGGPDAKRRRDCSGAACLTPSSVSGLPSYSPWWLPHRAIVFINDTATTEIKCRGTLLGCWHLHP